MAASGDEVRLNLSILHERVDREKFLAAARRLQAYKRRPVAGSELYRLFQAIDLAEGKSASLWDSIKYIFVLLYMSLVGFLSRLDTKKITKTLTYNSPSIGHRLRLKSSLAAYSMAVKASVGAQTLTRQIREDFCRNALSPGAPLDLDRVVKELRLPPPPMLASGHVAAGTADTRFGDDIAEARMAIEQLLVADVVSSYVTGLDAFVIFVGTCLSFGFTIVAAFLIFSFQPTMLVSALVGNPAPACQFQLLNATGGPTGVCIAPMSGLPVEDGTSLYRMHIYFAIAIITVPIVYVCLTGLALQILLDMVATVLADISDHQATLMFSEHPKNPLGFHVPEGDRQARGNVMLAAGSFLKRQALHAEAKKSHFLNELLVGRDSTLMLESADFLETFKMMRVDVADASKRVGVNVNNMLVLITQGLAALSVFLLVVNAITISLGQRLVVLLLFLLATVWVYILGSITRSARVYSFLVLAESSKYLNSVLHIDEAVGDGPPPPPGKESLAWPWSEAQAEAKHAPPPPATAEGPRLTWSRVSEGGKVWFECSNGETAWDLPQGAEVVGSPHKKAKTREYPHW